VPWHHGQVRILIIDDEVELTRSLRRGLGAEGYAVDVCHNGREGLGMATVHPYDAIILDVMLPGLNGFRVCARLRRAQVTTPVLMLTAKDGEYDEADSLDTGADDYLAKPFSHVVLLARLRALIRRGGAVGPPVLRVGDLWIDPGQRRCRRGDSELTLTAKQFAVLTCLARQAGDVVSKIDIIDEVWDAAYDGDVNIVEVYVRALRQAIDVPFGVATIQTVRGAGYRLIDAHG
jgi:DNA-binding response OmpR family regulator